MEKPELTSKESFTVIGLKYRGNNENQEIAKLWQVLMSRYSEIKDRVRSEVSYGVAGNMNYDSGEFDYLAGYKFTGKGDIPEGMDTWKVPEQKYAVFSCTLPTLMDAFKQINENWFPESGYERSDGPEFEFYPEDFNPQDSDSIMYIYIPLK